MGDGDHEWAGVRFTPMHHYDERMFKGPGLFGFVRRYPTCERVLLFVDHADCLASAAGPGSRQWAQALCLGMNELHINLAAREKIDRLQLRAHLIKRCGPLLNLLEQAAEPAVNLGAELRRAS